MKGNIQGLQREVNTEEIKSIAALYLRHQRFERISGGVGMLGPPLRERYQNWSEK